MPAGFSVSTPVVIQSGHTEAKGTVFADWNAPAPSGSNAVLTKAVASARIGERWVERPLNGLGKVQLGAKPKLFVGLEPGGARSSGGPLDPAKAWGAPLELVLAPGQTLPAWLKVSRQGHEDLVTFFAENLPHGVIVADIGLNGVLIPKGESEREIFFNAARWVPEQDRLFYLIEQQVGRQTSRPVLLKIRKSGGGATAAVRVP